jgi:cobalamin biosynthetic protein CobC
MRHKLAHAAARLETALAPLGQVQITPLFAYLPSAQAPALADFLARRGILVRRFDTPAALRFGLPGDEPEWLRLCAAIDDWTKQ